MKMTFGFDLDEAAVRLQHLLPEYPCDPREVGADASLYYPELYDAAEDGRHVLNTGKRDELLREYQRLRLREENRQLKEQADRARVVEDVRRNLRAVGVKATLLDGAAALFLAQHDVGIGDDGRMTIYGRYDGSITDCLQACVRFVERDHASMKGGTVTTEEGEFGRMVAALRN